MTLEGMTLAGLCDRAVRLAQLLPFRQVELGNNAASRPAPVTVVLGCTPGAYVAHLGSTSIMGLQCPVPSLTPEDAVRALAAHLVERLRRPVSLAREDLAYAEANVRKAEAILAEAKP